MGEKIIAMLNKLAYNKEQNPNFWMEEEQAMLLNILAVIAVAYIVLQVLWAFLSPILIPVFCIVMRIIKGCKMDVVDILILSAFVAATVLFLVILFH